MRECRHLTARVVQRSLAARVGGIDTQPPPDTPADDDTARELLVGRLREAGCVFAEDEALLLAEGADDREQLERLVARRCSGEPLERVLGWVEFCGLRILLDPGVFVPRRRTALLAQEAAALLRPGAVVVDLCCGSGAVGRALAERGEDLDLYAVDLHPAAVRCARRNLEPGLGRVLEGDLYDALPAGLAGRADLLVANAPYVPTDAVALMPPEARLYEPRLALDGGPDGLDVQRRVCAGAARWLAAEGHLLVETSTAQAAATMAAMQAGGLTPTLVADQSIDATVAVGTHGRALRLQPS